MISFSWHYLDGDGVNKDYVKANKYFERAAELGESFSKVQLLRGFQTKLNKRKKKVSDHFILYLDIMGYQNNIKKHTENQYLNKINNFINYINHNQANVKDLYNFFMSKPMHIKTKIFSDNIVIAIKKTSKELDNILSLDFLIKLSAIFEFDGFLENDIIIRGSITSGNLYMTSKFIFGDGLIKGYFLEDKVADYPRIVVDNKVADYIMNNKASEYIYTVDKPISEIKKFFLKLMENLKSTELYKENNYELQSLVKKYCNVIELLENYNPNDKLDSSNKEKIYALLKGWLEELESEQTNIFMEHENIYFVNHLFMALNTRLYPFEMIRLLLRKYKLRIEANLDMAMQNTNKNYSLCRGYEISNELEFQKIYKVWDKFCKLANYYNYYCDLFPGFLDEYKISY